MSVSAIGHEAWDRNVEGTSHAVLNKVMGKAKRRPSIVLIEAVARALDVPPTEFPEYRLAVLRRSLDEQQVGLAAAVAQADVIEAGLKDGRTLGRRGTLRAGGDAPGAARLRLAGQKPPATDRTEDQAGSADR